MGRPAFIFLAVLSLNLALLALATPSQMDTTFCKNHAPTKGVKSPPPTDPNDFQVVIEVYNPTTKVVDISSQLYSQTQQKLHATIKTGSNETILFVLPQQDQYLEVQSNGGDTSMCSSEPLEGSTFASLFNIKRVNGKLVLPIAKYSIFYSTTSSPMYAGKKVVRGINCDYWNLCAFQDWTGNTIAANLYYSRGYTLPGSNNPAVIMVEAWTKSPTGNVQYHRFDYTNFQNSITEKYAFMLPRNMWCVNRPEAFNLPKPPLMFRFQAQQGELGDTNMVPAPEPKLTYYQETYVEPFGKFEIDSESVGNDMSSKFKHTIYHDFNTGLQYNLNPTVGSCDISKISTAQDHSILKNMDVKMLSPSQFFDLTGNEYQYMGVHKDMDRDIDCDVFTTIKLVKPGVNPTNMVMIWYFASKDWMLNVMKMKNYYVLPVRSIIQNTGGGTNNKYYFDIYDYTNSPSWNSIFPDLTPCFPIGKNIYIDMLFNLRYDYAYVYGEQMFLSQFRNAMLMNTRLFEPGRLIDISVLPTSDMKTLIRFTLMAAPIVTGNVVDPTKQVDSASIYQQLSQAVNFGTFTLSLNNTQGVFTAKAIGIRQRTFKPSSSTGTVPTTPSTVKPTSSGSKGYSPGAMGGLAIGMLLIGVILGYFGFMLYKWKNNQPILGIPMRDMKV